MVRTDRGACRRPAFCRRVPAPAGARLLTADGTRRRQPVSGLCARPVPGHSRAGPAGQSDTSRRDRPRLVPGDPQPRELGHPPLAHQALTAVAGLVAGPHRSPLQPGLSRESITPKAVRCHRTKHAISAPTAQRSDMRRSRQPRPGPRAPGAHVLLAGALITAGNHIDHAVTAHRSGAEAGGEDTPDREGLPCRS